ncbi:GDP-L-fucose synthase [Ferrovibrio sp. MS7]|uniref:GDP-L-fucose synthase family protein n=1 Tax=Ferrovibrio plantarum TaxID=3119164 RepID=UPI003135DBD0
MAQASVFDLAGKRVWVAGHRGMAGSAITQRLAPEHCTLLTTDRRQVDLRQQSAVSEWMQANRPDVVILAAATVGGIYANSTRPADFIYDNLMIETNIIHGAHEAEVAKLVFLGSSCIYPRLATQPMAEAALLTGPLEPTNEWYAIAKIAGIKLCQAYRKQYGRDFITAMPTNLYGPGDNYDPLNSHVVAAMLVKLHNAKQHDLPTVEIWGTGSPTREFLSVSDMADAVVFLLKHYSGHDHVNVGTGIETSIRDLALLLADIIGFHGQLVFNPEKPDGMPRKVMDIGQIKAMGWSPVQDLRSGLTEAYRAYLAHLDAESHSE